MDELERSKFTPAGEIAFETLLSRRHEAKGAVPIPADYRVEIRDRQALAAA